MKPPAGSSSRATLHPSSSSSSHGQAGSTSSKTVAESPPPRRAPARARSPSLSIPPGYWLASSPPPMATSSNPNSSPPRPASPTVSTPLTQKKKKKKKKKKQQRPPSPPPPPPGLNSNVPIDLTLFDCDDHPDIDIDNEEEANEHQELYHKKIVSHLLPSNKKITAARDSRNLLPCSSCSKTFERRDAWADHVEVCVPADEIYGPRPTTDQREETSEEDDFLPASVSSTFGSSPPKTRLSDLNRDEGPEDAGPSRLANSPSKKASSHALNSSSTPRPVRTKVSQQSKSPSEPRPRPPSPLHLFAHPLDDLVAPIEPGLADQAMASLVKFSPPPSSNAVAGPSRLNGVARSSQGSSSKPTSHQSNDSSHSHPSISSTQNLVPPASLDQDVHKHQHDESSASASPSLNGRGQQEEPKPRPGSSDVKAVEDIIDLQLSIERRPSSEKLEGRGVTEGGSSKQDESDLVASLRLQLEDEKRSRIEAEAAAGDLRRKLEQREEEVLVARAQTRTADLTLGEQEEMSERLAIENEDLKRRLRVFDPEAFPSRSVSPTDIDGVLASFDFDIDLDEDPVPRSPLSSSKRDLQLHEDYDEDLPSPPPAKRPRLDAGSPEPVVSTSKVIVDENSSSMEPSNLDKRWICGLPDNINERPAFLLFWAQKLINRKKAKCRLCKSDPRYSNDPFIELSVNSEQDSFFSMEAIEHVRSYHAEKWNAIADPVGGDMRGLASTWGGG